MLRGFAAAGRWFFDVQRDFAKEKRRIHAVSDDYSVFRRDLFMRDDAEVLRRISQGRALDKWIDMADFALVFHKAANAPVHVTPHDKQRYLSGVFQRVRQGIQSGEIDAYRVADLKSLDGFYVRPADLWNVVLASNLPDGGVKHRAASFLNTQERNVEVPRPLFNADGAECAEEWLNIKLPLIYALFAVEDCSARLEKRERYRRSRDGDIPLLSNNPYMC